MNILNQIFKVLRRFVICIAITAGVALIAITLLFASFLTLKMQSYDWYEYISDGLREYVKEENIDIRYLIFHGAGSLCPHYSEATTYITWGDKYESYTNAMLSEIERLALLADRIYGGKPSKIIVEYQDGSIDVVIEKPASSPFTFISKKDKELYENAQPSLP